MRLSPYRDAPSSLLDRIERVEGENEDLRALVCGLVILVMLFGGLAVWYFGVLWRLAS